MMACQMPASSVTISRRSTLGNSAALRTTLRPAQSRSSLVVRAASDAPKSVVLPVNGDPFIGMMETPVTSSPIVAGYLSNLPAYRTGVAPLLRGVEIGLAHGLLVAGPFIKLGPLRNIEGVAEISGSLSAAGLIIILTLCLTMYGAVSFQQEKSQVGIKTLSGREVQRDPLQSSQGWQDFTAGWLVGGLSGVAFSYILTQTLPYYV